MGKDRGRTYVALPKALLDEIDRVVGPRKRSQFLTELAERELRRRRRVEAFEKVVGSLADCHIPEWDTPESTERWLRDLRRGGNDPWSNDVGTRDS